MNHITMLAQSIDESRPGNFFFFIPIKGVEETPLGGKIIPCKMNEAVGVRVYSISSNVVRSEPPMGKAIWTAYGQIAMFDGPEMSLLSLTSFNEINPGFKAMEVLTRCEQRSDLAAVLEMKLGLKPDFTQDPTVRAQQPERDITSKSTVVSRKKR